MFLIWLHVTAECCTTYLKCVYVQCICSVELKIFVSGVVVFVVAAFCLNLMRIFRFSFALPQLCLRYSSFGFAFACLDIDCVLSRYHLKDVIIGKIYFLLVRIKIKHMEIQIIKRETTGTGLC